ncbi:protein of unknown function DUF547 [Halothece sp. PCC 7418]|uniref:DUF547 domain-containing protein n=1 Tax=Halothece sp. (strain PCC 7418) TaxID=65093 RepID=UPI0002A075E6|nr:DUF547 domain-containing protein [Halothece sp. PCC 7418]AFZ43404.1 protein of unknown function DUF547 [Halothece sp. PCC 7418]
MIDYSVWDQLLKEYVNSQGEVDYQTWQLQSKQELNGWLDSLASCQLQQLSPEEQFTLLINLYNALVIREILKRYPIPSILPTFLGIPNWLSFFRFFARSVYTLDDQALSLNDIEHKMLRQRWQDPRIHFALVCAARGCPLLRNEAYNPTRIEEQLTRDAERFINNPSKVKYNPDQNMLHLSPIFKWYQKDFFQVSSSLPNYLNQYLSETVQESVSLQYLPYDWHLNEQ